MSQVKTKQLESEIHHKISEIIAELDNTAAAEATVTDVILNNDHSIAKVYVSFLNNKEKKFFELKKAITHIRKELSASLNVRKVPFIEFHLDDMLKKINEIEALIKKANK